MNKLPEHLRYAGLEEDLISYVVSFMLTDSDIRHNAERVYLNIQEILVAHEFRCVSACHSIRHTPLSPSASPII